MIFPLAFFSSLCAVFSFQPAGFDGMPDIVKFSSLGKNVLVSLNTFLGLFWVRVSCSEAGAPCRVWLLGFVHRRKAVPRVGVASSTRAGPSGRSAQCPVSPGAVSLFFGLARADWHRSRPMWAAGLCSLQGVLFPAGRRLCSLAGADRHLGGC